MESSTLCIHTEARYFGECIDTILRSCVEGGTMKKSWDATERHTLLALDSLLRRPLVRGRIDAEVEKLEPALTADPQALMAWEILPLSLFDPGLPETIQSSWVFILRKGCVTGAERHPNSHQRTLSYRGKG